MNIMMSAIIVENDVHGNVTIVMVIALCEKNLRSFCLSMDVMSRPRSRLAFLHRWCRLYTRLSMAVSVWPNAYNKTTAK